VGAEYLKPLDELKNLDQQVDLVTDLADLKPIFLRLDEIAKQHPEDFEVQLVVGDIKQHLVNRGTRIKGQQAAPPPPIPGPAAPPRPPSDAAARPLPPTIKVPPRVPPPLPQSPPPPPPGPAADLKPPGRLMSSGQFAKPSGLPSSAPPASPPAPPTPSAPLPLTMTSPVSSVHPPAPPLAQSSDPTVKLSRPATPNTAPLSTGQRPPAGPRMTPPPVGPPPGGTQGPPPNWKRSLLIGALIGAIATVAIIALLVNQARKRFKEKEGVVATVPVDVATTPPQASIRVNGDVKCTSPCTIQLAPGAYQVVAFLDGYDPVTSAVNVVPGQPATVQLALTAQPPSARILTDLDQGKITLDDQPPADLQEGQFVLEKLAPGPHTVKLTGRNGDASFSFLVTEAKPPEITGTVAAHNLIAVLVSSVGSQAHVFTSSGPLKLAVNGQPEGDAGPAGVELKNFHPGSDEIILGEGKDQRSMNETFTPAPMLTAFFKSDLNIGTLVVSTGEDDVRVFVNGNEYRRRTQKGQVRIPAIGPVSVRVVKDGFQNEPAQTAEVKKGAELRMEFKLKALPQVSSLQIHGATPGAEVLLDQNSVGNVGPDGNFIYNTVSPGDHLIDLRHDQFTPKRLQRSFKVGQPVVIAGADAVLAAAATTGIVKLNRTPADAVITYRRPDENQTHDLRAPQIELPAGSYIFSARAPGYVERSERVQIAAGETRTLEIALARAAAPPPAPTGDMTGFEDPTAWNKDGDLWTHRGGGFIPYKLGPKGVYTFTVQLVKGGNLFKGGRLRWCVEYKDSKNYLLYEMDHKNFWAEVVDNGKKLERAKTQHDLEKQKAFTIEIEITPEHCVHRMKNAAGQWIVLDSFAEPGRNFTQGKFGFLVQGNDEIAISDFSFSPK